MVTEKEYRQHVNTRFHINLDDDVNVELELVEVKPYPHIDSETPGFERFSLFFVGPRNIQLPQRIYPLQHAELGKSDIFLVPIGNNTNGPLYEAVFNFKKME
jgi:hypothetical protein